MGLFGYRTFTLYDFSTVVKLKIYVFDAATQFLKDVLPAQINPSSIDHNISQKSAAAIINEVAAGAKTDEYNNSITMSLPFNIVDEYYARTAGGKLPLSIDIDKVTIIQSLRDYSSKNYISVLKWGILEEVVYIKDVNCSYESYSPYGEPLAANVTVTFSTADDYLSKDALKKRVWIKDKISVAAELSTNYASTQFIPSIVSSARDQESEDEK